MKRAFLFLFSLLIVNSLAFAQPPADQSPSIARQLLIGETMRRRLSPPPVEIADELTEEPVLRIQTVALRLPDPDAGLDQSRSLIEELSGIYATALFQRQRFRETGQPIEFERGNLYFRQDRYVATKGLILHRWWNDRIDLGLYKRRFHGEASPIRGQAMWFGPTDPSGGSYVFSGGRQIFFGVRFKLDQVAR